MSGIGIGAPFASLRGIRFVVVRARLLLRGSNFLGFFLPAKALCPSRKNENGMPDSYYDDNMEDIHGKKSHGFDKR